MSYQGINTGSSPNDGTGDTLLDGGIKINSNFLEVYNLIGDGSDLFVGIVTQLSAGTNVSISTSYGSVQVSAPTPATINTTNLTVSGVSTLGSSNGIGTVTIGIGTTALYVDGSARVTGVLTVGTDSITINGDGELVQVGSGLTIDGSSNTIYLGNNSSISGTSINIGTIDATTISVGNQVISGSGSSTSSLNVSGISTLTGNVSLGSSLLITDNEKIVLGNSGEFEIYHNDSDGNVIKDNIESLNILSDNVNFKSEDGATEILLLNTDSNHNVELYYNGSKKLDTRSSGIRILGGLLVQSGVTTLGVVTGATYYGDGSNLTGLATTETVSTDSLVVTGVSTLGVVTGATYYGSGSNLTGVVTTLSGADGSNLTGITTLISAGDNVTVTTNAGITTISSSGITTQYISADSLVVSGISTLGVITASSQTNTGIVTALDGFISGISTSACQITFSGNQLTFTVAGIGSTSLTLF